MSEAKQLLFGGIPNKPSPEAFAEVRAKWSPERQRDYEAFESFRKSPANNGLVPESGETGATLEQVYNFIKLNGDEKYCLVSTDQAEVPTGKIQKVIKMTSHQLVEALKQINEIDGNVLTTLLYYDGHTGHCIILDYYDKNLNRFFYRDPWPWDSLLSSKNNMAGVDAKKEHLNYWSVTEKELASVVFAVFVYPGQWDRMQEKFDVLTLDKLKSGEFFEFFHLVEISKYNHGNETEVQYSPSNFQGIVVISLLLSKSNRIKSAALLMNKEWMKQNFMLVPDITRSFLRAFAPSMDSELYKKIYPKLNLNVMNQVFPNLIREGDNNADYTDLFLLAYAGVKSTTYIRFDYSILEASNTLQNEIPSLKISIIIP